MDEPQESGSILRFAPFQSAVDEGFWNSLCTLKLNRYGTDESPIPITGFYAPCSHSKVPNTLSLYTESLPIDHIEQSSLQSAANTIRSRCTTHGILYNTNTLESFNSLDRNRLLNEEGRKVWEAIHSGSALDDCTTLSSFLLISFVDLKLWTFYYWFAFPALVLDPPATLVNLKPASDFLTKEEAESLSVACNEWCNSKKTSAGHPFFLIKFSTEYEASIHPLADWESCCSDDSKVIFGFYDPCHLPYNPGWPLRNFLALIFTRWDIRNVIFFCYRETRGFADMTLSLIGEVLITVSQGWKDIRHVPKIVGWELHKGRLTPRCISLAKSMDPIQLAMSAAHLNLKLMRWRSLPSLNLEKLHSTKCLLLGAGTLGCQVARMLMAWGVQKMTILDNGKVSMSNPLRQSLYTIEDSLHGGEFKAKAIVKNLKLIYPVVEAEGVVMSIPMPGHPVADHELETVVEDCKRLSDLVDSHDAVFLLTDTRESRWLPTLICTNSNKIAITAALGFDTFLVMRHGPGPFDPCDGPENGSENVVGEKQRLGCYFCNDVIAPTDSTSNQSLDQQCTVTRPGLAAIASSLAVELFIGIFHHPHGIFAKGELTSSDDFKDDVQPLGILPHQIRGCLYQFSQMTLTGYSSTSCTACCSTVISEYRKRGVDFLIQAINCPSYLEELTGLSALKNSTDTVEVDWERGPHDETGDASLEI